jgi:integral membrane protein
VDVKTAATLHRLRLVSVPEAFSFPALLIFGSLLSRVSSIDLLMPLGILHGLLFVIYLVLLVDVWSKAKWPLRRVGLFLLLALLPFGGLYGDRMLQREERAGTIPARARTEGVVKA